MTGLLKAYEIGYLVRDEKGRELLIKHLERFGAEIVSHGEFKSIKLAYPIGHLTTAHFGYIHFKISPALISDLNNALKLDREIIRFLVITPPFVKEKDQKLTPEPVKSERKTLKPKVEPDEERAVSNDLLEEKLEEILNK